MEHTAAPWKIKARDGARDIYGSDGHGKIATIRMRRSKAGNLTEMERNAALIVQAPALLAELQGFVDRWSKYPKPPRGRDLEIYLTNARTVIARALFAA
jgi:hypothetical protein